MPLALELLSLVGDRSSDPVSLFYGILQGKRPMIGLGAASYHLKKASLSDR